MSTQRLDITQSFKIWYVYDLSRDCGFISKDWAMPETGLYESSDFKCYFENPTRRAFLIRVEGELAGFVLINKAGTNQATQWNMGEFFILAKFQAKGFGKETARRIWQMFPGKWEVSVIPENKRALAFWRKTIKTFTKDSYEEVMKKIDYDKDQPILSFESGS